MCFCLFDFAWNQLNLNKECWKGKFVVPPLIFYLLAGNMAESLTQKHQLENLPVCIQDGINSCVPRRSHLTQLWTRQTYESPLSVHVYVCVWVCFFRIMIKTQCRQNIMDTMKFSFEEAEIQTQARFPALQGEPCKCNSYHSQRKTSFTFTSE